jgi:hypothetical protein
VKALRVSERDWKHSVVRALIVSLLGKQTGLKGVMEKGVTQASLIDHEENFFFVYIMNRESESQRFTAVLSVDG